MEISDLMPQFMQNHDRVLPETIERTIRRGNTCYFDESWEILDQVARDFTRHKSCDASFG
jgi:hypothetical protein